MGADIHLMVEKKVNGKWEVIEKIDQAEINWYTRALEENRAKGEESNYSHLNEEYLLKQIEHYKNNITTDWLYSGRNYNLFAILADVRNGRGFAGIKTGEGFNPISDPRGVPEDASNTYLDDVNSWNGDGHSHSYHTLKQLVEYDWHQETVQYGVVPLKVYTECKENGTTPDSWSGGVSGRNIVTISEEQADAILNGDTVANEETEYYVQMKWGVVYKECSGSFYDESIPQLYELSEDGKGEDVRIVFFFDN